MSQCKKDSSTLLLTVILGTNYSFLLEKLCLALGDRLKTIIYSHNWDGSELVGTKDAEAAAQGLCHQASTLQSCRRARDSSRTLQAGKRGLRLMKGLFYPVTTTALMRPTSISQSNRSKDGAQQSPWRQARPSDASLAQRVLLPYPALCAPFARSLSFLNYCSILRNHES